MKALKVLAMAEPSVEVVSSAIVTTTACLLKEIDIQTCTVEDLQFAAPFLLKATDKGQLTGLVAFFDIEFSHCHQRVGFSTSPWAAPTHWKQTVFYLRGTAALEPAEEVRGSFRLWPNASNRRDLDFEVSVENYGEEGASLQETNMYLQAPLVAARPEFRRALSGGRLIVVPSVHCTLYTVQLHCLLFGPCCRRAFSVILTVRSIHSPGPAQEYLPPQQLDQQQIQELFTYYTTGLAVPEPQHYTYAPAGDPCWSRPPGGGGHARCRARAVCLEPCICKYSVLYSSKKQTYYLRWRLEVHGGGRGRGAPAPSEWPVGAGRGGPAAQGAGVRHKLARPGAGARRQAADPPAAVGCAARPGSLLCPSPCQRTSVRMMIRRNLMWWTTAATG